LRSLAVSSRQYLNAEQLAALTPWSPKAIAHMVEKGVLVRGVHYFQPQGTRTQLIFKWAAIVAFIEGTTPVVAEDGGPDVEATAAALERLLVREPCRPIAVPLPHSGTGWAPRASDRAS
jgi:hypothetical protein